MLEIWWIMLNLWYHSSTWVLRRPQGHCEPIISNITKQGPSDGNLYKDDMMPIYYLEIEW